MYLYISNKKADWKSVFFKFKIGGNMAEKIICDNYHKIEKITDSIFRIDESGIANSYLILGDEKALLIDSGCGVGSILSAVQSITDLPVIMAVTHAHCDHAGGRNWFKSYYVMKNDNKFIYDFLSSAFASRFLLKSMKDLDIKNISKKPYGAQKITFNDGIFFDLGNRVVKTINTPGHTFGSTVFIDEKDKMMFTGDNVNPFLWLQLSGSATLSEWLKGAEKIYILSNTYQVYCGHADGKLTKEDIGNLISLGKDMLKKGRKVFKGNIVVCPKEETYPKISIKKKNIK